MGEQSRRSFLRGTAACACCGTAFGLAGCVGGDDDGGNGGGSGAGEAPDDAEFEEFDPGDEGTWYPQLTSTYVEHGFETGSIEELETQFEERFWPSAWRSRSRTSVRKTPLPTV